MSGRGGGVQFRIFAVNDRSIAMAPLQLKLAVRDPENPPLCLRITTRKSPDMNAEREITERNDALRKSLGKSNLQPTVIAVDSSAVCTVPFSAIVRSCLQIENAIFLDTRISYNELALKMEHPELDPSVNLWSISSALKFYNDDPLVYRASFVQGNLVYQEKSELAYSKRPGRMENVSREDYLRRKDVQREILNQVQLELLKRTAKRLGARAVLITMDLQIRYEAKKNMGIEVWDANFFRPAPLPIKKDDDDLLKENDKKKEDWPALPKRGFFNYSDDAHWPVLPSHK
jgi:hypothetical protein